MKKIFFFFALISTFTIKTFAQDLFVIEVVLSNADGSVTGISQQAGINNSGYVNYRVANNSSLSIYPEGAIITMTFPTQWAPFTQPAPPPGWEVLYYENGQHGTIWYRNTATIPGGHVVEFIIPVQGIQSTGSSTTSVAMIPDYTLWEDGNGVQDQNSPNNYTTSVIKTTSPVPLNLLSFDGKASQCDAVLFWETAKEINFSHFELEYSTNGKQFANVGRVAGGKSAYEFSHKQANGDGFYRLKMLDNDGIFSYSGVVKVRTSCDELQLSVYPSPFVSEIYVKGAVKGDRIKLVNIIGQTVHERAVENDGLQRLDLGNTVAAGSYNVIIESDNNKYPTVFKVIKH